MAEWSNWAGNVTATPRHVVTPGSVEDLAAVLQRAAERGDKVRPVGAGHSFTPIAQPVDIQVRLAGMRGIVSVDEATHRVRVRAGTHLYELVEQLAEHGLALANMGDIDRQTISGAISTSTHGTGLNWTGFGATVVGGEMVTGAGEVLRWSKGGENDDLVPALGVTLGALGVLTEVELQCVPAFTLHAVEKPSTLTDELASLEETLTSIDHYEFYWFPHTDKVLTKRNTRQGPDAEVKPLPRWRAKLDDEIISNTLFGVLNEVAVRRPSFVPRLNRVSARALSAREFSDRSHAVYASPRSVRFRESEMAVPRDAAEPLLRELQAWVARENEPVAFPVEVRWTAPDDVWMSSAHGRESCYIAIHQYVKAPHERYFQHFWDIAREYDARPHWGKMHDYDAAYLAGVYPRFEEFLALRERFDPQRVMTNPYLDQVLGA